MFDLFDSYNQGLPVASLGRSEPTGSTPGVEETLSNVMQKQDEAGCKCQGSTYYDTKPYIYLYIYSLLNLMYVQTNNSVMSVHVPGFANTTLS